jgi:hypothetical protein
MVQKVNSNYDFSTIERIMFNMEENHSSSDLNKLKNELNKFFIKAKCREILYTVNTDKLFFGMRVYPVFDGNKAIEILGDNKTSAFEEYYVEFDSKLFDPMLGLNKREKTAILLHEIGHIVYDTGTIDEVRSQIDMYFAKSGDYVDLNSSKGYRELIGYALKDSVVKAGSLFSKFGNTEMVADTFVVSCGYGPDLESAMRKIVRSSTYMAKSVDDRFITLSWVLRLRNEFTLRRIPAVKTLNKAKQLTASKLEQREIVYASDILNRTDLGFNEGFIEDIRARFSKKFNDFKVKGIRSIKNDIYELNLRLRTAESAEDLMYIIRQVNTDVTILQDYMTEDLDEADRQSVLNALEELYDIRQRAAKEQVVRDRYDSAIQVIYPNMD